MTTEFITPQNLLGDYAAGDAVAGSAGGIGLVVIRFRVDDDCGATVAEERVGITAEVYIFVLDFGIGFAVRVDGEVFHVAGVVAFRIFEAVLLPIRIKVRAC